MLQWEWPQVWDLESREAVRVAIEHAIRKAMSTSTSAQIRGKVDVDVPHLGSIPPELVLSGLRQLTLEHTALMVKLRYDGDFSIRLRGLQINLDTVGANAEGADDNFALPFFCPFELSLQNFLLDGMASIEVFHEFEDNNQYIDRSPTLRMSSTEHHERMARYSSTTSANMTHLSGSNRSAPSRTSAGIPSGYGILLAAGGRGAMRSPDAFDGSGTSLSETGRGVVMTSRPSFASTATLVSSLHSPLTHGAPAAGRNANRRCTVMDLVTKRMVLRKRTLKIQLFGDPLKSFEVVSNFSSVPAASSKVEGTIKMLLKPAIMRMMTDGLTVVL